MVSRTVGPAVAVGAVVTQRVVATARDAVEEKPMRRPCPAKGKARRTRMLPIRIMHGKQPSRLVRNGVTPNHVVRNIRKMIGNSSFNHKAEKICRKEERIW